jgi:hypothetical protein
MEKFDPIANWTKNIAGPKSETPADLKNRPMTEEELNKRKTAKEIVPEKRNKEEQLEISF